MTGTVISSRWILLAGVLAIQTTSSSADVQISLIGKKAVQSGTFQPQTANLAIDGDPRTYSVACTTCDPSYKGDANGWWMVDLGDNYSVTSVAITSPPDGTNAQYLTGFLIGVETINDTNIRNNCYFFNNGSYIPETQTLTLNCQYPNMYGRYVIIKRQNQNGYRSDAISFGEVNVYSTGSTISTSTTTTSTSRSTTTSTTTSTSTSTTTSSTTTSARIVPSVGSVSMQTSLSSIGGNQPSSSTQPLPGSNVSTNSSQLGSIPAESSDGLSPGAKIGVIVGVILGALLLIGCGIILFCVIKRCNRTSKKDRKVKVCREINHGFSNPLSVESELYQKNIKESELYDYVNTRKQTKEGFRGEFKSLPEDELQQIRTARLSENRTRNRFQNVLPYDVNMVQLSIEDFDDPEASYINASFIDGYKNAENVYIATQGPKSSTVDDFWRMVWQQNVNLIIMITPLIERNKIKCEQYWPEVHNTKLFHKISVTLAVEETFAEFVRRELFVHDERQEFEPPRKITHLHFVSWADKTRPDQCFPFLSFRRRVKALQDVTTGPIVVHCSAGIGRTGTYIAIDILLKEMECEGEISVHKCVERLRHQRMNMVQTVEQYEFIYEALLEDTTVGDTSIPCSSFNIVYSSLKSTANRAKSELEDQFVLLKEKKESQIGRQSAGLEEFNKLKNRNVEIVAYDDCRVFLEPSPANNCDYINASFVNSYRKQNAFILTQLPLPETTTDFWQMVSEYDIKTIVYLEELMNNQAHWPENNSTETYGSIEVTSTSIRKFSSAIYIREFQVTSLTSAAKKSLTVQQYQLSNWRTDSMVPEDMSSFTELINLVLHECLTNDKIIIQCKDGATRSGLFAISLNLIDMMKTERVVDVFVCARHVAVNRPQVIDTLEQYQFLHDLASSNLDLSSHDEYANLDSFASIQA